VQNYRKVFAKVYVVVAEPFIDQVLELTDVDVGVMCLARWNRVTTVREAVDRADAVCPTTIFDSLRLTEAMMILESWGAAIPDLPNTKIREAVKQQFVLLPPQFVHAEMVRVLKGTRSLASLSDFVDQLPHSLKTAALSTRLRLKDHQRLLTTLNTPTHLAMEWAI